MRNIEFTNDEYYHVYNRGVDKRTIVEESYDSGRLLQSLDELNTVEPIGSIFENSFREKNVASKKLVEIISYCINPNHYHLLLLQKEDRGIEKFMHRLGTSYTKYFNNKYKRGGSLFQGRFKAIHIYNNDYLLHLSAYINLNNRVHQLGSSASKLVRSSWNEYIEPSTRGITKPSIVIDQFKNKTEYEKYAIDSLELMLKAKDDAREFKISNMEFE